MALAGVTTIPSGGFNFENCLRNSYLESKGFKAPKATKTGTTIVGIIFRDGVILGADTRATSDTIVADKNCEKIHYLAPNMYCCGAGTAADTQKVTEMVSSNLELHRLATDRIVPVCAANRMLKQHLFRYQGFIGAALIVGGVDEDGPHIFTIYPHGSSHKGQYVTMGSGSLAAMSVFERGWRPNMSLEEGKQLVRDAIRGGIFYDMGSGSNVDLCIITKEGAKMIRPFELSNMKGELTNPYDFKRGSSAVLTAQVIPIEIVEEKVLKTSEEAMDISG